MSPHLHGTVTLVFFFHDAFLGRISPSQQILFFDIISQGHWRQPSGARMHNTTTPTFYVASMFAFWKYHQETVDGMFFRWTTTWTRP